VSLDLIGCFYPLPYFYANCLATDNLCHGHLLATPASGKIWQEFIFMACEVRCCNGVVCYKLGKDPNTGLRKSNMPNSCVANCGKQLNTVLQQKLVCHDIGTEVYIKQVYIVRLRIV